MHEGSFCFLTDQYFIDFPDPCLMRNGEIIDGVKHDRPCYFSFADTKDTDIMWLVPITSDKKGKYRNVYNTRLAEHKPCDGIEIALVAGYEKAFLIQNMCPATAPYIRNVYVDSSNTPIGIDSRKAKIIERKARKVLQKYSVGVTFLIKPDVKAIYSQLITQLEQERAALAACLPPTPADLQEAEISTEFSEVIEPTTVKERLAAAAANTTSLLSPKTPETPER